MKFNPGVVAATKLFFFNLVTFTVFRLLFYFSFYKKAEAFSAAEALHAFEIGFRFDLRLAVILILPILIFSLFKGLQWQNSKKHKTVWLTFYTLLYALIALTYAGDIGYYAYLESRINFRIFEFAKNLLISAQMVMETYNVPLWSLIIIIFSAAFYKFLSRFVFAAAVYYPLDRKTKILQSIGFSFLILLAIHNSFNQYPLRWSDAFFSQNRFVSSLGLNPIQYIFDTAENSKLDFDTKKVKKYYSVVAPYLGVTDLNEDTLNFKRPIQISEKFTSQPNIVYIVMESMAAYKTGTFGNTPDASPNFDRLAKKGWLFRNFYTPAEGTARSLFCVLTDIPDINSKSTSSRNPLIINQHTLINGFKGYEKYYFIGGSASWGNIRGLYVNNIHNLHLYEGADLGGPTTDVWGLSDLDLFRESAGVLREKAKSKKPFFALIQSASFHRPYTIPEDHGDFKIKTLTEDELHKYGFRSNEEYNSFRMADYSLGEFFKIVKNDEYFKNTIFIIHGDHGLPHDGAEHLSEGYKFFGINRFHTPLLFYSPLITKPQEIKTITTEPDVMATILGSIGMQYPNTALGQNVLALDPKKSQYAFSYVYYSDPLQIMLYDSEFLAYGTENGIESLHQYKSSQPRLDVKEKYPEKYKEMSDLLLGIFETSKYMLHHNPQFNTDKMN